MKESASKDKSMKTLFTENTTCMIKNSTRLSSNQWPHPTTSKLK